MEVLILYTYITCVHIQILLLKGIHRYENKDSWRKFNDTLIPNKESFYSDLELKNTFDFDYKHETKFGMVLKGKI